MFFKSSDSNNSNITKEEIESLKKELVELSKLHHDFVKSIWKHEQLISERQVDLLQMIMKYIPEDEFSKLLKDIQ